MDRLLESIYRSIPYGHAAKHADMIGVGHQVFLNKINPHNEHHHLSVQEFSRLLDATQDFEPLKALADRHGFELVKRDIEPNKSAAVISLFLKSESEHSDVVHELTCALGDGRITRKEAEKAIKEIDEDIVQSRLLRASLIDIAEGRMA